MRFTERVRYEVRDWRRCHAYHRNDKKHAKQAGSAFAIQRTELPLPVFWSLIGIALFLMYVLTFGGVL